MSIEAMKQALEADTEGASMSEQPTALRLADLIEGGWTRENGAQAAAELRRLHSVNAQLLEALEQIIDLPEDSRIHYKVARRAIAAAKEKS